MRQAFVSVRFRTASTLLLRFLAETINLHSVREHIESRLTGISPTMTNIAKPSLLDLDFPLPDASVQHQLAATIAFARESAATKRTKASTLRQSAWATFESALFTAVEGTAS